VEDVVGGSNEETMLTEVEAMEDIGVTEEGVVLVGEVEVEDEEHNCSRFGREIRRSTAGCMPNKMSPLLYIRRPDVDNWLS
jgi:hypothetical protein